MEELKKIHQEIQELRVKVFSGQSLEKNDKSLGKIEIEFSKLIDSHKQEAKHFFNKGWIAGSTNAVSNPRDILPSSKQHFEYDYKSFYKLK